MCRNKLTKAAEYSSMVEKTLRVEVNDDEMVAQKEDILTEKATSVGRLKLQWKSAKTWEK